jgi:CBS domain-containing protein
MSRLASPTPPRLSLARATAQVLMSPNPVSLDGDASIQEAIAMLTDRGFSAAPVIDAAGRPIGVLSRGDILVHEREQVRHARLTDDEDWEEKPRRTRHEGYSVEVVDPTRVRDVMTPVVFTVDLRTPAAKVVEQMLALRVHRLFVVDEDQALVGVVSTLDVLRHWPIE